MSSHDEEYATPTELGNISEEELPPEPGTIEDMELGVADEDVSADPEGPDEDNTEVKSEINDDEDEEDDE